MAKEYKINWLGIFLIFASAFMMAIMGMGLSETVLKLNNYQVSQTYATFVSYFVSILMFWLFSKNFSVTKEKEVR